MNLSTPTRSVVPTLEGRAFSVLAHSSEPLTGAAIARLAGGGSVVGMRLALGRLVDDGTVRVRRVGSALTYSANRDHVMWPAIETFIAAADSAMARLQSAIVDAMDQAGLAVGLSVSEVSAAFYGSVARGDSTASSDVDVLMVFPDAAADAHMESIVNAVSSTVMTMTGNECNVYAISVHRLGELVAAADPMVSSWRSDARSFAGPDVRQIIRAVEPVPAS